ncbi:MAG: hypothetical protein AAGA56_10860 [Myxococcota bacterium]
MPYRALSSPKKLANLEEEVVALAPHEKDRLVGVVTTDPVRLGLFPYSGNHKVIKVSLDEAHDLAVINKAVVVIRSGSELWALLGVQHSHPKIEQVGRDIRALHAHPGGGTAFSIGHDGQGAALELSGHEVGGRHFVLRGSVRAARLGFDRTYVVVQGDQGGQFREHPGSTPESASLSKVDLPAAAAGFNRLAAGPALAALSKRGAGQVCIVRRGSSSALEASMIDVASVVDVAVIDTSLFVLQQSGSLLLFNQEALASPEPAATATANVGGTPTAMCTTTKGGARLWIGTREGDVMRIDAVKGGLEL